MRTYFPYKGPLSTDFILAKIKDGSLFGYVTCVLDVPKELKSELANFPVFFSVLLENVSIISFNQWLMLEEKAKKPSIRSCSRNNETLG